MNIYLGRYQLIAINNSLSLFGVKNEPLNGT
ncbi:hypothetical protein SVI_2273 [Shewanella violacea DSS12]|uniref:Uncharacterized protein n=1 Tax=Shewanella violacea (strain JCM 10179 / CIP 106290 / LMG 19151 / DSS12) TaxID=637905 RepID=D4ZKP5_SHEVD|nr:hypothetical protein SVI_2273 [Shewanella violacea DSS12]